MKLIYAHGFSNSEKLDWKPVVFNNVVQSFQMIFEAMNEIGIGFENPENEASSPSPPCRSPRSTSYPRPSAVLPCGGDESNRARTSALAYNDVAAVMSELGH